MLKSYPPGPQKNVNVFGKRVFKEISKLNTGIRVSLIPT
jgi:hypothetical protein